MDAPRGEADRHNNAGMSLVETMVVMSIVALSATLIALTLPRRDPAGDTLRHMQALARTAEDAARLTGQPVGIMFEPGRLWIAVWRAGSWQSAEGGRLSLPAGVVVEARKDRPDHVPESQIWPLIIFDPLGHTEPTEVRLVNGDLSQDVTLGGASLNDREMAP